MIITVTLNPALDKSVTIPGFSVDMVNRVTETRLDAGGKGINVCKVLKSFGCDSVATGFLGGAAGDAIICTLDKLGISHDFTRIPGETRTNLKAYDPVRQTYTDINEPGPSVDESAVSDLFDRLCKLAKPGDTVLFAGSSPIGIADDLPARWAGALAERGVRIAADLDGARLKAVVGMKPFLIKPNEYEIKELCGLEDTRLETLACAARELVRGGIAFTAVSMGAAGALFADASGILSAKGPRVEPVSTVGAGDTLMAALLYAKEHGFCKKDAVRLAVAAATAKVTCPGSSPPTFEQTEQYLSQITIEDFV